MVISVAQLPNFHKWAQPANEQGALPTLSLLPGAVCIRALPRDRIYQTMEIEPKNMWPAILHGFGAGGTKHRMPEHLHDLAAYGLLPMAVSLFGTPSWCTMDASQLFACNRIATPCQASTYTAHSPSSIDASGYVGTHRDDYHLSCLRKAAQLLFGPPEQLKDQHEWIVQSESHQIDVVKLVCRRYTGAPSQHPPAA